MNFLPFLTVILVAQLAGTVVQLALGLPVPGAVIGMFMLFAGLVLRKRPMPEGLNQTASTLLRYLPLLFIPAGVGVMQQFTVLGQQFVPIMVTLFLSCFVTIAFTGLLMQLCLKLTEKREGDDV